MEPRIPFCPVSEEKKKNFFQNPPPKTAVCRNPRTENVVPSPDPTLLAFEYLRFFQVGLGEGLEKFPFQVWKMVR